MPVSKSRKKKSKKKQNEVTTYYSNIHLELITTGAQFAGMSSVEKFTKASALASAKGLIELRLKIIEEENNGTDQQDGSAVDNMRGDSETKGDTGGETPRVDSELAVGEE